MILEVKLMVAAILALLLGALGWATYHHIDQGGYNRRVAEEQKMAFESLRKTEIASRNAQAEIDKALEKKDETIRQINDRLATALERLRRRPERAADLPDGSPSCAGASGAGLSGPDAGFLEREAARGNRLRAALGQCYEALDAVERSRGAAERP